MTKTTQIPNDMAHVLDNRLFQKPCRLEVDLDATVTKFVSIVPQIEQTMIEEEESMEYVSDIPIHTTTAKKMPTKCYDYMSGSDAEVQLDLKLNVTFFISF